MADTTAFSGQQLREWKSRLESDSRNPVNTDDLFNQLPSGIRIAPVYDAASFSEEHAYLREFHAEWKRQKPDWKPLLMASSVVCGEFSEKETAEAEKTGIAGWCGSFIPAGHRLPADDVLAGDPVTSCLCQGKMLPSLEALKSGRIPAKLHLHSASFHQAGANEAEDLAYCLLLADYYSGLSEQQGRKLPEFTLHLAAGPQFFLEIARLRALRLLWMNWNHRSGRGKSCGTIQSESSLIYWSKTDPDSNLLRHTSSALAAIAGGADSLLIHPHTLDAAEGVNAIRLAADIGHLALEEARMKNSFDPGSGSYLIEMLTHELAKKAWALFCEWRESPMEELMKSGFFVDLAQNGADRLKSCYAEGKIILTGVNRHPSALSRPCPAYPLTIPEETEFKALRPVFLDA